MGKKKEPHPLDLLPFTAKRDGKQLPKPTGDQWPRCFWHVHPTGDYGVDTKIGQEYALAYLDFEENDVGGPGCLNLIVQDSHHHCAGSSWKIGCQRETESAVEVGHQSPR